MAADDQKATEPNPDFLAHATGVFARELFQPMVERANIAPGEVQHLISEIRHKLNALEVVVATIPGAPQVETELGSSPHPALQAALESPVDPDRAPPNAGLAKTTSDADSFNDIGRNQRSRLRELTLLDFMSRENRAYTLQQVLNALNAKGFDDSSGAVVSQLHRLKKLGVTSQPAGGMYEITHDGLAHLHQLRASFGSMLGEPRR